MMISLNDIQRGYDRWAAKPHNAKWLRKIGGTPIANDIVVNIFEELKESALSPQPATKPVSIVPPYCSGSALGFDPGTLHVNKDGSGYIAINEDDFVLEDDRCEGEHGPEGSVHWIVRLDASEIVALRDFLNVGAVTKPAMGEGWMLIETAPRSYKSILACNPDKGHEAIVVHNGAEWELLSHDGFPMGVGFYPTHWHPLPAPPATGGEEL